jgi:hypothetical protein
MFDRISGGFGVPIRWKLGTARSVGDILWKVLAEETATELKED